MRSGASQRRRGDAPLRPSGAAALSAAPAIVVLTADQLESLLFRAIHRVLELARGESVLSTTEAARLANRSAKTIRRWVACGELRAGRRGRDLVIRRPDLDAVLAGRLEGRTSGSIFSSLKK